MKRILFASHNDHKVAEIRLMLPQGFSLLSLRDINWTTDIPEPFETYEENAIAKAQLLFNQTGLSCFADDSGLEVEALDGRPGVFSARYAGIERDSQNNIKKLLSELSDVPDRKASFHSVIAYVDDISGIHIFKGKVDGIITKKQFGNGGFGYDPVFIPEGFHQTFGELSELVKNRISHRAIAMKKLVSFLQFLNK
ncbi:MAG: RdgB/HAM1 family non-canonical purine NTP pyrophosphatase [Saprospiraceae bacterium]